MSRTNLIRTAPVCGGCGTPTEDLDENGECFECADVPEPPTVMPCVGCGNDDGYFDGRCLDCLDDEP